MTYNFTPYNFTPYTFTPHAGTIAHLEYLFNSEEQIEQCGHDGQCSWSVRFDQDRNRFVVVLSASWFAVQENGNRESEADFLTLEATADYCERNGILDHDTGNWCDGEWTD